MYDLYDLAEPQLKSFTRSSIRTKIMLYLLKGETIASDLAKEMDVRSSTILHSIKEMIDSDLIVKTSRGYDLTNLGRIQALILDEMLNTLLALDQNHDFWLNHDLSSIPERLKESIGMLYQWEPVKTDKSTPFSGQSYLIREMSSAKEISGVTSVMGPGYMEAMAKAIDAGAKIDLILTDKIMQMAKEREKEPLNKMLKKDNIKLYSTRLDIKLSCITTDDHLFLGLYRFDESYDLEEILICRGESPKAWGLELFNYYSNSAQSLESFTV